MTAIGTEYVVVTKPIYWGGGRYAQNKADLQEKPQNCMENVQ